MTVDPLSEQDAQPQGDDVSNDELTLHDRSDFWVGLLVIGGVLYGLLTLTRVIFY